MKKKNLVVLSLISILFLLIVSSIVVYSFQLQKKTERREITSERNFAGDDNVSTADPTDDPNLDTKKSEGLSEDNDRIDPIQEYEEIPTENLAEPTVIPSPTAVPTMIPKSIILGFAGDVNLDEDSKPVARYDNQNKGILGALSPELIEEMNLADIMMLNNEFAFSTRGTETPDKSYTFRANPKRVDILKEMGVDIVSLANNHTLDFGYDALEDTFATLEEAGIDYVGAGNTLDQAKAPVYYTIGDKKIAYVAASRVVFAMDWYATDTRPGMIGTYDPTLFLSSIKEADENSDFVVAYVHWGVERTNYPVEYQKTLAKQYIDAGADVVVGCHPHVMQGIEFYKGKPIAYSLGNYWFNASNRESGLLKIILDPDDTISVQLLPVMQENTYTYFIREKIAQNAYYKFMEEISFHVTFDENGYASEKIQ